MNQLNSIPSQVVLGTPKSQLISPAQNPIAKK